MATGKWQFLEQNPHEPAKTQLIQFEHIGALAKAKQMCKAAEARDTKYQAKVHNSFRWKVENQGPNSYVTNHIQVFLSHEKHSYPIALHWLVKRDPIDCGFS